MQCYAETLRLNVGGDFQGRLCFRLGDEAEEFEACVSSLGRLGS